ncbi:hypothetical protein D1815_02380 [Aquimarina sp. AD1]|uniref:hypothetical protein n=1 Tax=Aquimarina sp. (strain AD1) TaxID=1714848 RepID=UPI000E4EA18C|nr:hypothetical protein [Aquimarina sp. AD1]AXT54654.1 hypothetical protein D1815_02380 [Aquimarina sp. AD1]RKN21721.1 hypothetical protein D7035_12520 [Aquimarina sp. AD1]
MKTPFLIFILYFLNLTTVEIVGKYQIENDLSFDTLELKDDGTYEYLSRGDSCWTWSDIKGIWELKEDVLILHHNYSYVENATEYIEQTDEISKDFVIVQIKDNFGKSISDFEVNYSSIDWKKKQTKKTDENGIVKFDKYGVIYNKNDSASIQIKYLENGKESSESAVVERNSDRITININSEPKTIHKREKYSFEFKKGKLKSIEFPYVDEISSYKKL